MNPETALAASMLMYLQRYPLIELCALNNHVNGFGTPVPSVNLGYERAVADRLIEKDGSWYPALAMALAAEVNRRPKNPDGTLADGEAEITHVQR